MVQNMKSKVLGISLLAMKQVFYNVSDKLLLNWFNPEELADAKQQLRSTFAINPMLTGCIAGQSRVTFDTPPATQDIIDQLCAEMTG